MENVEFYSWINILYFAILEIIFQCCISNVFAMDENVDTVFEATNVKESDAQNKIGGMFQRRIQYKPLEADQCNRTASLASKRQNTDVKGGHKRIMKHHSLFCTRKNIDMSAQEEESANKSSDNTMNPPRESPDISPSSTWDNTANESDGQTSATDEDIKRKMKRKKSKERRQEIRRFKRSLWYSFYKLRMNVPKIHRVGQLGSSRYLVQTTQSIQRDTIFKKKFFCYTHANFVEERNKVLKRANVPRDGPSDIVVAGIVHMYSWPVPFPMMRYKHMSDYGEILKTKYTELHQLEQLLPNWSSRDKNFVEVRLIALLAFVAIGEGKFGIATNYLERGCVLAASLEPCEWTAWLYLAHAFLYICWGGQTSSDELYSNALPYLEAARNHFMADSEKGATFNLASSLILWWMFLIKSRAIRCSWSDERCFNDQCKHGRFVGVTKRDRKYAAKFLSMFQQEAEQVKQFPHPELCKDIIEIFEKDPRSDRGDTTRKVRIKQKAVTQATQSPGPESSDEEECGQGRQRKPRFQEKCQKRIDSNASTCQATSSTEDVKINEHPAKSSEESCIDIRELYQQLKQDITGKVPPEICLQGSRVISKGSTQLIVLNVTKGCKEATVQFIARTSPDVYRKAKLLIVEQKGELKLSGGFCLALGVDVACCTDEELRDGMHCFGTLGGYLYDKRSGCVYGSTADHVVNDPAIEVHKSDKKQFDNIHIELMNADQTPVKKYVKISDKKEGYHGLHGQDTKYRTAVDFGIFPLHMDLVNCKGNLMSLCNQSGRPVAMLPFVGPTSDMLTRKLQKIGQPQVIGGFIVEDEDKWFNGCPCSGYFAVKSTGRTDFVEKGHSGAWVSDVPAGEDVVNVYGVVQGRQEEYTFIDDNGTVHDVGTVGWCLCFDNQIKALNRLYGLDLAIYNADRNLQQCQPGGSGGNGSCPGSSDSGIQTDAPVEGEVKGVKKDTKMRLPVTKEPMSDLPEESEQADSGMDGLSETQIGSDSDNLL